MGNFSNVTMGGGVLKINDVDVGFLRGDVVFRYEYETEEFKTGVPLTLQGSVTREVNAQLSAPLAEITPENLGIVLGGIEPEAQAGDLVDKTGAFEEHTFEAAKWSDESGIEVIKLGNPDDSDRAVQLSAGGDAPVMVDESEEVTYSEGSDYIVDYTTGYVYRNPAGSITQGQVVKVKYKYTPDAARQLNLGHQFSLTDVKLEFVHTNPNVNKKITVVLWKARTTGSIRMNFSESKWIVNQVTFKGIYDQSHSDNPMGYVHFEL